MPFEAVQDAFAAVTRMDTTTAGIVLGLIVVVVLLIAFAWALGEAMSGFGLVIAGGVGVVFVVLVEWWPVWTIIFIGLLIVFIIVNPWGSSGRPAL